MYIYIYIQHLIFIRFNYAKFKKFKELIFQNYVLCTSINTLWQNAKMIAKTRNIKFTVKKP